MPRPARAAPAEPPVQERLLQRLHELEIAGPEPQALGPLVANLLATLRPAAAPGLSAQAQATAMAGWDAAVLRLHALPPAQRPAAFAQLRDVSAGWPPQDRAVRLAALLDRLGDLPPAARGPLFTDSLRALRQELPPHQRAQPLAALLRRVNLLHSGNGPADDRPLHQAVGRAHASIQELPLAQRAEPLAALLDATATLPAEMALRYHEAGHRWVSRLPPEHRADPLAALLLNAGALHSPDLSPQVHALLSGRAEAARDAEYGRGLRVVQELPPPHRSVPLAALLDQLDNLVPDPGTEQECSLKELACLPPEHRGEPLAVLVNKLRLSEKFSMGEARSIEACERLLGVISALPPDQQAAPLAQWLLVGLDDKLVPADGMAAWFERGHGLVDALPPQHRSKPLAALLLLVGRLPHAAQADLYGRGARWLTALPPDGQAKPLAMVLAGQADLAPAHWYRQGGYQRGLRLVAALPTPHRAEALASLLASIERYVPAERQVHEYRRGLKLIAELPLEHREWPMGVLLRTLEQLPPRDRATEYERALHLVGLLPPDHRTDLAGRLVSLLLDCVIDDVPAAERVSLSQRSLRLMGEEADQRWTPQEQADRQALQILVSLPPV